MIIFCPLGLLLDKTDPYLDETLRLFNMAA